MGAGMLLVQHRRMVAHPPRLIRAHFHRLLCVFCLFSKCSCAPQQPRAATRPEKSLCDKSTAGFRKTWRQRAQFQSSCGSLGSVRVQHRASLRFTSAFYEHLHVRRRCHRNPSKNKVRKRSGPSRTPDLARLSQTDDCLGPVQPVCSAQLQQLKLSDQI